jgi:signal transduction histidine kinase
MTELVVAVRWASLCLSLAAAELGRFTHAAVAAATVLVVLGVLRTVWPLHFDMSGPPMFGRRRWPALLSVGLELGACSAIVGVTGGVSSPFVFSLGAAAFVTGLIAPPWALGVVVVPAIVAVAASGLDGALSRSVATRAVEQLGILAAASMLGSYSEWLLRTGRGSQDEEVERLRSLTEVNHLLLELHAKAASLPASLSLKAAVNNAVSRLRDLLSPDIVVLLLGDPVAEGDEGSWHLTLADGVDLPPVIARNELPPALFEAMNSLGSVRRSDLAPGEGVAVESCSGLYVPLWARGSLIGLLAVERVDENVPFGDDDLDVVEAVARHAGLAIDNARWFRRLRALGAEEERGRIARELHDRLGQSLAYVGLSLERLAGDLMGRNGPGTQDAVIELTELAAEVRRAGREVRTKLSDLRLEPGPEERIAEMLAGLLARAEMRSGIATAVVIEGDSTVPPAVEREITRIAQEAINNAERHSNASRIDVRWLCDARGAELQVADDGRGMPARASLRHDAFGILGMRERADAIGASLAINSVAGKGTTVTLRLRQSGITDGRLSQ